jgi:hypothetical protein
MHFNKNFTHCLFSVLILNIEVPKHLLSGVQNISLWTLSCFHEVLLSCWICSVKYWNIANWFFFSEWILGGLLIVVEMNFVVLHTFALFYEAVITDSAMNALQPASVHRLLSCLSLRGPLGDRWDFKALIVHFHCILSTSCYA